MTITKKFRQTAGAGAIFTRVIRSTCWPSLNRNSPYKSADRMASPSRPVGQAREWLRSDRGNVQWAAGSSVDDARMDYYAAKYGLGR